MSFLQRDRTAFNDRQGLKSLDYAIPLLIIFSTIGVNTTSSDDDEVTQKDVMGWVVTAITAAVASLIAAVALWHNAKATKAAHKMTSDSLDLTAKAMTLDANAKYVEFIKSTSKELNDLEESTDRELTSPHRKNWEPNYLNAVDRLAVLVRTKRIPDDLADYFRSEFRYAKHIIENSANRREREESFKEILQICNDKHWDSLNLDK